MTCPSFFAVPAALALAAVLSACTPEGIAGRPSLGLTGSGNVLAELDAADRQRAEAAQAQVLDAGASGKPVSWRSPDHPGRFGAVAAGPLFQREGRTCRPFTQTVYVDNVPQTARATACREAGGAWKVAG